METKIAIMGTRLKALRNEKKVTQRTMASLLEVTDRHYQAIEAGSVNIPSLTLKVLADYFEVSADRIIDRPPAPLVLIRGEGEPEKARRSAINSPRS